MRILSSRAHMAHLPLPDGSNVQATIQDQQQGPDMTLVLNVTTVVSQATCPGSVNSREEYGVVFVSKNNHTDKACRYKNSLKTKDKISQSAESTHRESPEQHSFALKTNSRPSATSDCVADLLVDCGATTHYSK